MKKTPFDKILVASIENPLKANSVLTNPVDFSRNHQLLWAFIGTLQVKYLHMYEASEPYWDLDDKTRMQRGNKGVGNVIEEMINANQKTLRAKLNYFSFIEELSRYGRIFERKYKKTLPDYYRIKFFRNKMVEHWDEYLKFRLHMEGLKIDVNKLVVPYHMGIRGGSICEIPALKKKFKNHNIPLALRMESPLDPNYSEQVFRALETIDHKLGRKLPDDLIDAIFKYGFPTPIHDLEEYSERLVAWIESL